MDSPKFLTAPKLAGPVVGRKMIAAVPTREARDLPSSNRLQFGTVVMLQTHSEPKQFVINFCEEMELVVPMEVCPPYKYCEMALPRSFSVSVVSM